MIVEAERVAYRPSQELTNRFADLFTLDIPQRLVDATHRTAIDNPPTPEILTVHDLPEMLHPPWVESDEELRKVLDGPHHRLRFPLQRCLAPSAQTGLISLDLYKNPVA